MRGLVGLSLLSLLVTVPHSIEDFRYGIAAQFHLGLLPAAFGLAVGYAVQVTGLLLASHRQRAGYLLSLAVGLIWFGGAVLDHLHDVLATWPYRGGLISKALEVLVLLLSAAIVVAAAAALWGDRKEAGGRARWAPL
ncbi:MAG: hypothetical protein NVSMB65_11080 [Chloroflexota bacterium]